MSRVARSRLLMLVVMALPSLAASSAGAVTWHNTGSTAFTATAGPMTLSVGANNLVCSGASLTGTAPGGSLVSTVYSISGTATYSPCALVGQSTFVHCTWTVTGSLYEIAKTGGTWDKTCHARLTAAPSNVLCVIHGTTPGQYTNPAGATFGRLTSGAAASSMVVTNGNVSCPLGTGGASSTEHTFNLTAGTGGGSSLGPVLNRTA